MRLVSYHTHDGHRVAIVDEPGRKYLHLVFFDAVTLSLAQVPLDEARHMRDIIERPRIRGTPLQSTARRWLRLTATAGARELLERAAV